MLGLPTLSPALALIIVLATLGFATVGTFFAGISVQTRSREILLPVLFFPVVVPVIIGAVEASALALQGGPMVGVWTRWVPLLVVFDALFLVICSWIFGFVFEG
jgi:ABC-type transport system involved in cytochrome c biogenesis permease component